MNFRMLLSSTAVFLIFLFVGNNLAQDKGTIKSLIKKYESGVEISKSELEQVTPFLRDTKIIKQNNPYVPGKAKADILVEDFSGGALPAGWTNVDDAGTNVWEFNNPGSRTINTTTNANGFVILDSDNYGGGPEESRLTTQVINCSGNTSVFLEFEHFFRAEFGGSAELLVSGDNGANWTSLETWSAASTANAESESYDITAIAAGNSEVLVQWFWQGDYSWYWAVDDVRIYEPSATPVFDLSPVSYDYGTITIGSSSSEHTFTISNTGGGTLNISGASITGSDVGDFSISNAPVFPQALTLGQSFTLDVTFTPTADGPRSANLTITGDAKVDHNAELSGMGHDATLTPPFTETFDNYLPIDWTETQGTLADPSTTSGTSSSWVQDDYGNVTSGPNGKSAKVNIYGTSTDEWLITPPIDLSAKADYQLEFDLALTDFGNSNAPDPAVGDDDKFAVLISTDGTTWSSANALQIWDNTTTPSFADIPNTGQHIVMNLSAYSGTVWIAFYGESKVSGADVDLFVDNVQVREIPSTPIFNVSPASQDFGLVLVSGSSDEKTFTVSNTGGGTLTIASAPTFAGTNPEDFSLTTDPNAGSYPINLAGGETTTFGVTFTASDVGARSGILRFSGNVKVDHDVTLTGLGYTPFAAYSENFDAVTTPALPDGWSAAINSSNSFASVQTYTSSSPNSAPNHARLYNSGDVNAGLLLITPGLSSFNTNRIRFMAKGSTGYEVVVGTISDPSDAGTFTPFGEPIVLSGTYTEYRVDFTTYSGTDKYIAFKHNLGGTYRSIYIDDFFWEVIPAVAPACAVVVTPDDSALTAPIATNLEWAEGGGAAAATGYRLYFGTDGGGTTTPTSIVNGEDQGANTIYDHSALLDYSRKYYWQVVPYNANGDASDCPIWTFTTEDNPNFGGGDPGTQGGYYFANSTSGGSGAAVQPSYSWVDPVAGGHTEITAWTDGTADDGYFGPAPLGFTFNFFGNDYTECFIGSNGLVTFDAGYKSTGASASIPAAAAPNNIIAVLMQDLDDRTNGKIYYGTAGTDFVVTWYQYCDYGNDNYITFQVLINPGGNIIMQYNPTESTNPLASGFETDALIGIENSDGTMGIQYRNNGSGGGIFDDSKAAGLAVAYSTDENGLPVEITSFTATADERNVCLKWETATELNSHSFEIERTKIVENQKSDWQKVGELKAAGNSNVPKFYTFVEKRIASGNYLYRLKSIDIDGSYEYGEEVEVVVSLPLEYGLSQNYPNPFNPSTIIEYSLPVEANVNIEVYNIVGEKVLEIVNGNVAAGFQSIDLNMSNFTSGVYIYRIIARSDVDNSKFTQVKKMMLLK